MLGVLFGNPGRSFYANEIIGLARSGSGAVQRELAKLHAAGLVTAISVGNQRHYQANAASPLFPELRGLAVKTFALADVLRSVLDPKANSIQAAFVYGSVAKNDDTSTSDIDLFVISDELTYGDLFEALERASLQLGRKVSPTIYSVGGLAERSKQNSAFVRRVLDQPKIWLIGDEDALSA